MKKLFENFGQWASPATDEDIKATLDKLWINMDYVMFGNPQDGNKEGLINDWYKGVVHNPADLNTRYDVPITALKTLIKGMQGYARSNDTVKEAQEYMVKLLDLVEDIYLKIQQTYAWAGNDPEIKETAKQKIKNMQSLHAGFAAGHHGKAAYMLARAGLLTNFYNTALEEGASE